MLRISCAFSVYVFPSLFSRIGVDGSWYYVKCLSTDVLVAFCFLFSDVLVEGIWQYMDICDPSLDALIPDVISLALGASANATLRKYSQGWSRWKAWASSKVGVSVIPAQPLTVSLYLAHLVRESRSNNQSASAVETAVYSIRWAHNMAGLPTPTDHSTVKAVLQGARRELSRPVRPKEPLSEQSLNHLADYYNKDSASLEVVRFLFIVIIGYSGLFRISEILAISLNDINILGSSMSITIHKRKNDQFREGHTSFFSRSGKVTCPVSITERLISLLPSGTEFRSSPVVRRIIKSKKHERFHERLGICYSTALESIRKFISPFVSNGKDYGTHSLKSGGASNSGFKQLKDELMDRHAGWKNPRSKYRYMKRSSEELSGITKAMNV